MAYSAPAVTGAASGICWKSHIGCPVAEKLGDDRKGDAAVGQLGSIGAGNTAVTGCTNASSVSSGYFRCFPWGDSEELRSPSRQMEILLILEAPRAYMN